VELEGRPKKDFEAIKGTGERGKIPLGRLGEEGQLIDTNSFSRLLARVEYIQRKKEGEELSDTGKPNSEQGLKQRKAPQFAFSKFKVRSLLHKKIKKAYSAKKAGKGVKG